MGNTQKDTSNNVSKMEVGSDGNRLLLPMVAVIGLVCLGAMGIAFGWNYVVPLLLIASAVSLGAAMVLGGIYKGNNSYMKSGGDELSMDRASMLETPGNEREVSRNHADEILQERSSTSERER